MAGTIFIHMRDHLAHDVQLMKTWENQAFLANRLFRAIGVRLLFLYNLQMYKLLNNEQVFLKMFLRRILFFHTLLSLKYC